MTASSSGLTGATSTPFTITVGAATQLAFSTQPGGGANGARLDRNQPAVSVEDVGGNPVPDGRQLHHPGPRHQPRRHAGLHHQPAGGVRRHGDLRRLQDHRQGGQSTRSPRRQRPASRSPAVVHDHRRHGHPACLHAPSPGRLESARAPRGRPSLCVTVEDASGNIVTNYATGITLGVSTYSAAGAGGSAAAPSTAPPTRSHRPMGWRPSRAVRSPGPRPRGPTRSRRAPGPSRQRRRASRSWRGASQLVFTTQPGGNVTEGTAFTPAQRRGGGCQRERREHLHHQDHAGHHRIHRRQRRSNQRHAGLHPSIRSQNPPPVWRDSRAARSPGTAAAGTYTFQATGGRAARLTRRIGRRQHRGRTPAPSWQFTTQPGEWLLQRLPPEPAAGGQRRGHQFERGHHGHELHHPVPAPREPARSPARPTRSPPAVARRPSPGARSPTPVAPRPTP